LFWPKNKKGGYTHVSKGTDEVNSNRFMEGIQRGRGFLGMQEEAVKDFRQRFINGALEAEREMIVGCKSHERTEQRKDYRNGYWTRWITLKDGRLEIRMPRIRGMKYESVIIPGISRGLTRWRRPC